MINMITIFPVENILNYNENNSLINKNTVVLSAKDNNNEIGYISFNIENCKAQITHIVTNKDYLNGKLNNEPSVIVDSLVRAAVSYLLNRNIFILESYKYFEILAKLNFNKVNSKMLLNLTHLDLKCQNH